MDAIAHRQGHGGLTALELAQRRRGAEDGAGVTEDGRRRQLAVLGLAQAVHRLAEAVAHLVRRRHEGYPAGVFRSDFAADLRSTHDSDGDPAEPIEMRMIEAKGQKCVGYAVAILNYGDLTYDISAEEN